MLKCNRLPFPVLMISVILFFKSKYSSSLNVVNHLLLILSINQTTTAMKTILNATLVLLAMGLLINCSAPNPQNEIDAIKAAIELETSSFYKVDEPTWENSWAQAPYAYWSYSDSTGTSFIEGWDNINKNFDSYFKTQVASRNIDVAHPEADLVIERDWKEFRVYGDGAFVQYAQRVKDKEINRDETSQIRVMEKKDGKWLVTYVGIIAKYP
jgi:hypothetical protein